MSDLKLADEVAVLKASLQAMRQQRNSALDNSVSMQAALEVTQQALTAANERVQISQQQWSQTMTALDTVNAEFKTMKEYSEELKSMNAQLQQSNKELSDKLALMKAAKMETPRATRKGQQ